MEGKADPKRKVEASLYGWDNEKDHEKTLIYIPKAIERHKDFPIMGDDSVEMEISDDGNELIIRNTE